MGQISLCVISHLQQQQKKYNYYIVGGDFNLNWKEFKNREKFKDLHLTQIVKEYTRVQDYKKYNKRLKIFKDRTTKSLIDLIFVSDSLRQFVKDVTYEDWYKTFDHKAVGLELEFPKTRKYRYITVPLDPL